MKKSGSKRPFSIRPHLCYCEICCGLATFEWWVSDRLARIGASSMTLRHIYPINIADLTPTASSTGEPIGLLPVSWTPR
jgi:hypothetical protein